MDTLPTMKPNYVFILVCCILSISQATVAAPAASNGFRVRAVNLGGWLVTEGWMKPSLFDAIPNRDLLDGTTVQFKSVTFGKYLSAEHGGGTILVANKIFAKSSETFKLWRINETTFNLKVHNNQFIGLDTTDGVNLVAVENTPCISETFVILRNSDDPNRVRIKASNGFFLQVMEEDFKFISSNGLNAVRIPVGWWIAYDPNPPKPFVGGSLKALDNAFKWATKYGLKVLLELHAAPGSQNGFALSGSRDGTLGWGLDSIEPTVAVIEFLAARWERREWTGPERQPKEEYCSGLLRPRLEGRYAKNPSLYSIGLMNEPSLWVSPETVMSYYGAGYDAVRRHTSTAYVVMGTRMWADNVTEFLPFAAQFERAVLDVHLYNFYHMTVDDVMNDVYTHCQEVVSAVTTSDGPLSFVAEWTGEWMVPNATKEEYQRFAKAQLEVFDRATFGWAYWTFKHVGNHWSLEWMINNGYINLTPSNSISISSI
nr:probable glucan 1,3-beta-glucosidase A [Ipomoea batatas]